MNAPVLCTPDKHYNWGDGCDGWRLFTTPGLSVIEEMVPPGKSEGRHFHSQARQFFYILSGKAILGINSVEHSLPAGSGMEVEPGAAHKFMNNSSELVRFLVISSPSTHGDRTNL